MIVLFQRSDLGEKNKWGEHREESQTFPQNSSSNLEAEDCCPSAVYSVTEDLNS